MVCPEHQQRPLPGLHVTLSLSEPPVHANLRVPLDLDVEAVEYVLDVSHPTVLAHDLRRTPSVVGVEQVTGDLDGFALTALAFLAGVTSHQPNGFSPCWPLYPSIPAASNCLAVRSSKPDSASKVALPFCTTWTASM